MNYTPNDLQNLTFKKSFMGYSEDMVNDVLDKIIEDYTVYIRENVELKDKLALLNEGLQHYKTIEESLQNTLLRADRRGTRRTPSRRKTSSRSRSKSAKAINDANQKW